MQRLSVLMWIALTVAVIPLLALPIWLMKIIIVSGGLIMAGLIYSLLQNPSKLKAKDINVSTPTINHEPKPRKSKKDKDPDDQGPSKDREPVDITNPDTDRFIARNTYKSRSRRLGNDN